jgi:hypothetical protein
MGFRPINRQLRATADSIPASPAARKLSRERPADDSGVIVPYRERVSPGVVGEQQRPIQKGAREVSQAKNGLSLH